MKLTHDISGNEADFRIWEAELSSNPGAELVPYGTDQLYVIEDEHALRGLLACVYGGDSTIEMLMCDDTVDDGPSDLDDTPAAHLPFDSGQVTAPEDLMDIFPTLVNE